MIKILLTISTGLVNAGVPTVIMKIVSLLRDKAVFDIIVVGKEKNYYDDLFESYGGRIFRLPRYDSQRERFRYSFRTIEYIKMIRKILHDNGPYDVLHCNDGIGAASTLIASREISIPIKLVHSHGTYNKYKSRNIVLQLFNRMYLKVVRNYPVCRIACSEVAGITLFGYKNNFINVLNPVDINSYRSILRIEDVCTIRLLQLGYFCRNKNQLFSLKLLNQMILKGLRVHLSLMGFETEKKYVEQLNEYIEQNNLKQYVTFLPHDANKNLVFANIDIMLLPSFSEGLPLVLLEAQSAGIKCIVSDKVPTDGNVGLCKFISLDDIVSWENEVLKNELLQIDYKKLDQFDTKNYVSKIAELYAIVD